MRKILFLAFLLCLSACSVYTDSSGGGSSSPNRPLSYCDQKKAELFRYPVYKGTAQDISISRVYQRVIRKNCQGYVTSDRLETVNSPHKQFRLPARGYQRFHEVFVLNGASCDSTSTDMPKADPPIFGALSAVTGDGLNEIWIKGDMADAIFTFHMGEHLNNIYVQYFYDRAKTEFDIVEYPVTVNYSETTLSDIRTVEPSRGSCETPTGN